MIIRTLAAKNILKYESLELDGLPEEGLIAISGQNESGKSSIGEAICFALFGRTFSLGEEDIHKIVRWGESQCSAMVLFATQDGQEYEVARFLDTEGNHSARLNLVGKAETPLARGVQPVASAIAGLVGYEFEEFIESFYLAQREITTPHPHSHAVKVMAGVAPLERAAAGFAEEILALGKEVERIDEDVARVERDLDELAIDDGYLPSLQESRSEKNRVKEELDQQVEDLESAAADYEKHQPELVAAGRSRKTWSVLRGLFILLALVAGVAWVYFSRTPAAEIPPAITDFLNARAGAWEARISWLAYLAGGFGVLFLLSWTRIAALRTRIRDLGTFGEAFSDQLARLRDLVPVSGVEAERIAEMTEEGLDSEIGELTAERYGRPSDDEIAALRAGVEEGSADPEEVEVLLERETNGVRECIERKREDLGLLEQSIGQEKERLRKADLLEEERRGHQDQIAKRQHRIELRKLAGGLLEGSMRQISRRFNRNLRDLVGRTLPLLTEGRYEHLQIDDDLSVRVFSSEKRDFMDLEEISSGTQRQVMLAVRLALSQELVDRAVHGPQFLILDEPFAFFDHERTRSALSVLPKYSKEISQIWIISQEFPAESTIAMGLECTRDSRALTGEVLRAG